MDLTHLLQLVEVGRWEQAWQEFERIRRAHGETARLLLIGSHAAYYRNDFFLANHLVHKSIRTIKRTDPPALTGKVRFHVGMVARRVGDHLEAEDQFQLFLEEMPQRYPELVNPGEGKAWYYLGLVARARRCPETACDCNTRAAEVFRQQGHTPWRCKTLHNHARVLLDLGRVPEAAEKLGLAAQLIPPGTPPEHELALHQKLGEAHVAFLEQRFATAVSLTDEILQLRNESRCTEEDAAQATWLKGHIAFLEGDLEQAEVWSRLTDHLATVSGEPRLMNDANDLRTLIYRHRRARGA